MMLHGDLQPGNILLAGVIDFGDVGASNSDDNPRMFAVGEFGIRQILAG